MTGQPEPDSPTAFARAILESLAFKYRAVLESLEELTGRRFDEIRIVGGGSRNRLLKQLTADATGRTVTAGPVEATALGNIGAADDGDRRGRFARRGARGHRSVVPGRAVRADRRGPVGCANTAGSNNTWSSPVPETASTATKYLQNLWDEAEAARLAAHPLELLRYRSNLLGADLRITNFGGGNTSSKFTLPDPLTGEPVRVLAVKGSGGDLRSIGAVRLRRALPRQARTADRALSRRSARRRDGRLLPAVRVRREPRRGVDRHAAARVPAVRPRRSPASRLGIALAASANGEKKLDGVQRALRPAHRLGAVAAARASSWADAAPRGRGASRLRRHPARQPRALHVGRRRSTSAT